jgi:hypothetical protein
MKVTKLSHFALCWRRAGFALFCALSGLAGAAELHMPSTVEAGRPFSISVSGSGQAAFYLMAPDHVVKRTVTLGSALQIDSGDVASAGRYQVILCDSSSPCASAYFEVKAATPTYLSFFLHPSRVPVSFPDSIDATAFVFDRYYNLVLTPITVDFRIAPANGAGSLVPRRAQYGVAWIRTGSTAHEGPVQVTAVSGNVEEARVIEQVAAEACQLRMKAVSSDDSVTLQTDPVRDCSGNALPDGTVVSFTKIDKGGKSTVDTPIKKGVARTQFRVDGPAQISVACGVVLGNEVALNANGNGKL